MNKATRKRQLWVTHYGEDFLNIREDEELTNDERVIKLNLSNIPTSTGKLGQWDLFKMIRYTKLAKGITQ